jgi:lauroyl/myristoyl acyltransferase
MIQNENEPLLFAATSANFYNFLGDTNVLEHRRRFADVIDMAYKAHQDLLTFQVDNLSLIDDEGILPMLNSKEPPIFVMFHTGSFNMLTAYLLKSGSHFYGLSDAESLKMADYQSLQDLYNKHYGKNSIFGMINIEESGSIFRILKMIKEGFPTIAFIDGNKGIGGQDKTNGNLEEVDFLSGRVRVRRGLATLAYLTNRPLVLALNHMENDQRYLSFRKIPVQVTTDKKVFIRDAIQTIFKYFGEHVKKHPDQWCNWPYVHNWTNISSFQKTHSELINEGNHSPNFNAERFCPIKFKEEFFLFDRETYNIIRVESELAPIFSYKTLPAKRQALIQELIQSNNSFVDDFRRRQVFI